MKRINNVAIALAGLSIAAMLSSCKSDPDKSQPQVSAETQSGRRPLTPAGDSPILVRGGSLGFHGKSLDWTLNTGTSPHYYSAPLVWKDILLEGTSNDTSVPITSSWKIALNFRDYTGGNAASGPEIDICSNLKSDFSGCDLTYSTSPSNVFVFPPDGLGILTKDSQKLDGRKQSLRYHLNTCLDVNGAQNLGLDSICDHIGLITISVSNPPASGTPTPPTVTTYQCTGGTCNIGISDK